VLDYRCEKVVNFTESITKKLGCIYVVVFCSAYIEKSLTSVLLSTLLSPVSHCSAMIYIYRWLQKK